MEAAAVAQVLLAVVLLVSGLAKAGDAAGTTTAAAGLGVPSRLAPLVARVLPALEVLAAVLLVLRPRAGVLLALALLLAFIAAVALALAQGRRPTCRCFGRLGGGEVSGRTLARNALLLGAALLALVDGPVRPELPAALVGAALGCALLGLEVLDGRRSAAVGLAGLEESLERTSPAPELSAPLLSGGSTDLAELLAPGRPLLLVVLAPGCGGCISLVPLVRRWDRDHGDRLTLAVLGLTSPGLVRDLVGDLPVPVLVDESGALRDRLGVSSTPAAVLITADHRLVGQPAVGRSGVERLLDAALAGTGAALRDADHLGPSDVAAPVPGVLVEEHEEGALLRDPLSGAELRLDRLGALVWSVLDERSTLEEVAADLADAFGAPVQVVERDVLELARQLGRAGLLRGVRAEQAVER